jgi:hypothetical protein
MIKPRALDLPHLQKFLVGLRLSPLMTMGLAGLAALNVVCALFALHAMFASMEGAKSASGWQPPGLGSNEVVLTAPAQEDTQTLSRPIFSKSRRPAPKSASAPRTNVGASSLSNWSLAAIVRHRDAAFALIITESVPEGKWVQTGESYEGWTIADMDDGELTLQNGQQTAKLKLYNKDSD